MPYHWFYDLIERLCDAAAIFDGEVSHVLHRLFIGHTYQPPVRVAWLESAYDCNGHPVA